MTVRIVTDSTADIPAELAKSLGITIVPLTVIFGDESYLDILELDNAGFYQKLKENKTLPKTSQPSPATFQATYTRLIEEGADGILAIHLSSGLSGTYQSSCTARDTLPDEIRQKAQIEIVDSRTISAAMSGSIIQAAKEAREGLSLEEIKAHAVDELSRSHILVALDSLEWVRRGGRIGAAKALLGNMLNVKPILTLRDGEVVPLEQPRTRSKAVARIVQLAQDMSPLERIAIAESDPALGDQLIAALQGIYPKPIERYLFGAVLGAHTGPGTAGIGIITAK